MSHEALQWPWVTAFISDLGLDQSWEAGDFVSSDLASSIQKGLWNFVEVGAGGKWQAEAWPVQRDFLTGEALLPQ